MGSRAMSLRSGEGNWWLMVGLFSLYVVGWSLMFSLKTVSMTGHSGLLPQVDRAPEQVARYGVQPARGSDPWVAAQIRPL